MKESAIQNNAERWFTARIIKEIVVEGELAANLTDAPQKNEDNKRFEESFLLIRAKSRIETEHAAKELSI